MPNHCTNILYVTGPDESVRRFVKAVTKGDEIKIADLIPMPEELRDTTHGFFGDEDKQLELMEHHEKMLQKYGASDWYEWAHQHWGTKWGDYDHYDGTFDSDGEYAEWEVGYQTAWCPFANNFWEKVVKQFPDLMFIIKYEEPGMCFCGVTAVKYQPNNGGVRVIDKYVDNYISAIGGSFEEEETDDNWSEVWERRNEELRDFLDKLHTEVVHELLPDRLTS